MRSALRRIAPGRAALCGPPYAEFLRAESLRAESLRVDFPHADATCLFALFARRERHGIGDMQQNLLETRVFRIKVLHEAPLRL